MRITILFGGTNKERLVSVASAQALHPALPEADLWFWDVDDTVHEVRSRGAARSFAAVRGCVQARRPRRRAIEQALDQAKAEDRLLVLGLHGGRAENGELQAMCEMRGIPFTGSGSASSHLAFDKVAAKRFAAIAGVKAPSGIALEDVEAALAEYGRLIAKPARDGSSYGLIFVNAKQDLVAVRNAARTEEYLIEPFIAGVEATCGVLEQPDGSVISLPPIEIVPAEGGFDYTRQISAQIDPGDLPGPLFARDQRANHGSGAQGAPGAVVQRLFPFRLHRLGEGADLSRNQYLAGPDQGLALSEGAQGAGDRIRRFPAGPDRAGGKTHRRSSRTSAGKARRPDPTVAKILRLRGKVLRRRIKTHPARTCFTLCLPGSPKVNAGGACGAWLPGRELLRISASTTASRERASSALRSNPPGMTRRHLCQNSQAFAGITFDELVQWMVQDASLDR